MKKLVFLSSILAMSLIFSSTLANVSKKTIADSSTGFIEVEEGESIEDRFSVQTLSPWADGTKWEIAFDSVDIDKAYIAFDYDVTSSVNNPELIVRLGINGDYFKDHDGETVHGSNFDIMKQWGDWFFLVPGRNLLYLPVANFCSSAGTMNKFGLYFDTGFNDRSGSINIYGLYLLDNYSDDLDNNIIAPKDYKDSTDKIATVGVNSIVEVGETIKQITAACLYGDYLGAMEVRMKTRGEGGVSVAAPDDYAYITIDLGEAVDVSEDEGFAFSVFANSGETFFRVVLEDNNGYFYGVDCSGGSKSDATTYPMYMNYSESAILTFYGCLYLADQDNGTVYIPYKSFSGVDHMFESDRPTLATRIQNIKRIHVGLDTVYGLGRRIVLNEFATCDVETKSIESLVQLSQLSDTEWNRTRYQDSTRISVNNSATHQKDFAVRNIDENEVPGARGIIDLTELNRAINLAKSLNKADYTEESWDELTIKLENAENLVEYSDLYEQNDFDTATRELLLAIRKLQPTDKVDNSNLKILPLIFIIGGSILLVSAITVVVVLVVLKKKRGAHHEE